MSYIYLQGPGVESSAADFSAIESYVLSKSNPTASRSSCNGSGTGSSHGSRSGTISGHSPDAPGADASMSSAEASLARTSVRQGKAEGSKGNVQASGRKWQGSFARYSRCSSSWRTPRCSGHEGSTKSSVTWPKWGMMRDGACWELTMPELRTRGSGCGLWRTPTTSTGGMTRENLDQWAQKGVACRPSGSKIQLSLSNQVKDARLYPQRRVPTPTCSDAYTGKLRSSQQKPGSMHSVTLAQLVERRSWPTPLARDYRGASTPQKLVTEKRDRRGQLPNAVAYGGSSIRRTYATPTTMDSLPPKSRKALEHEMEVRPNRSRPSNLRDQIANAGNWPTPCAQDFKKRGQNSKQHGLPEQVAWERPKGQLNPMWVEWLMGWPIGWTSLQPLSMSRYQGWWKGFQSGSIE